MAGFADYDRYDALGLAELVRARQVSPKELLDEARARCDRVNPKLNAVIYRLDAEAEKAAEKVNPDRPFAGVPFLAKDLGPALAGAPLTTGSKLFANYVPQQDGELIKRFKASGLTIFGKTNVPELGLVPVTEPELFGPCRNPWNEKHTPGGSSGGAASAVASGIVPMAHASDGGGSIRIPASCCGLFGLKTSLGLNPQGDSIKTITIDFGVDHVLSRSVRDSAAALDAVCDRVNPRFLAGLETPPEALRVAVVRSAMLGAQVAPEVKSGLDNAAKLMERLGHRVEDAEPKLDYADVGMAFLTYWAVSCKQILDSAEQTIGRKAMRDDVELTTWTLSSVGAVMSDADVARARTIIAQATQTVLSFFDRYDILISPTLAAPPLRIGQNTPTAPERMAMRAVLALKSPGLMKTLLKAVASKSFAFAAFTAPFNMTGQPAMSVPLHWTASGLPVGVQFAAKLGEDALLLRLARQLELAQPWAHRHPALWAGDRILAAA
jgi:Asp-tRNA(Asn)/Glu-tRNA(Gln) amidotransferase A subunit family amidase